MFVYVFPKLPRLFVWFGNDLNRGPFALVPYNYGIALPISLPKKQLTRFCIKLMVSVSPYNAAYLFFTGVRNNDVISLKRFIRAFLKTIDKRDVCVVCTDFFNVSTCVSLSALATGQ